MKVYIVRGTYSGVEVYANKNEAKARAKYLKECAGFEGSNERFWVEEKEVK